MKNYIKILFACLLLVVISSTACAEEMWQPSVGSYKSDSISPDYQKIYLTFSKPVWSADVKFFSEGEHVALTLTDGKTVWVGTPVGVKAIQLQTGKQLWFASVKDIKSIAGNRDKVFVTDKNSVLNAIDKATGKMKWNQNLAKGSPNAEVKVLKDNLYVRWRNGLAKLDPNTGKILWKISRPQASFAGNPILYDDVLIQSYVESGAITVTMLYAFDDKTGKQLWSNRVDREPLFRMGNRIYLQSTWFNMDSPEMTTIVAVDLHTGKGVQEWKYPRALFKTTPGVYSMPQRLVVSDGYLYIDVDKDIKKFFLGVAPDKFYASPKGVYSAGKIDWLAGPVNGIMLYDVFGSLKGDAYDADIYYEGVNNPISSIEVVNRAIVIGQSDGRIVGCDFLTGKNYFIAKTEARTYQAIKLIDNYLLVQGDGKLYVYAVPKLAALAKEKTKPHYTKTTLNDVKVSLDEKVTTMKEDIIMLSGNKMLPVQEFVKILGGTANEDKNSGAITLKINGNSAELKTGEYYAKLNGQIVGVNPAPQIIGGIAYVPKIFLEIMLDGKLKWNHDKKTYEVK